MEKLLRASGHHPVNRTSPKQMTDDDSEYIRCSKCGKMITQDVDEVEEHTRTCVTIEYKKAVYNAELQAAAFAARSRTGHAGL
mmetsp:Transcript_49755/g.140812  ORF Transcript_49755/g.140812 Transcript_49755/m.140812 type:complete len:83 (-) Transcript_49755:166-414(-)